MYNICNTYVCIQHGIFSRCSDARSSRLKGRGLWRSGFNGRIFWDARVNELRHLVGFIFLRLLAFLDVRFFLGGTRYSICTKGERFTAIWMKCMFDHSVCNPTPICYPVQVPTPFPSLSSRHSRPVGFWFQLFQLLVARDKTHQQAGASQLYMQ